MGRIGLSEILIILAIAFIFIQPKDLLHFVRRLGKAYQQMKSMRDEFVESLREVKEEMNKAATEDPRVNPASGRSPRQGR
jgi:Sec-independent protein translocase protein TatA